VNRLALLVVASVVVLAGGGTATGTVGQLGATQVVSRPTGTGPIPPGLVGGSTTSRQNVGGEGRYVVFVSSSDGLSSEDDDRYWNVYVRDRVTNTTILVSRADGAGGAPANADSGFGPLGYVSVAISADGSHVAFASKATNLVPGVTTPGQLYVRDLNTNQTVLASRADGATGAVANAASGDPSISADGHRVAFDSDATNLGDPTSGAVWVRDLNTNKTILTSRANGPSGTPASGSRPSIDANGDVVAFATPTALVAGDTTGNWDVYTRNLTANTTYLMSLTATGPTATFGVFAPSISGDGTKVGFETLRSYDGADANTKNDVYVSDGGNVTLVSRGSGPGSAVGNDASTGAALDSDGAKIAFSSCATNLVAESTGGSCEVFVRNVSTQTTTLASRADGPAGAAADGYSTAASITPDGTKVGFASGATNIAPPAEQDNVSAIYLRDLGANTTSRVDRPTGTGIFKSETSASLPGFTRSVSADGRFVAFTSYSNSLSSEDDDRYINVFVRDVLTDTTILVDRATGPNGAAANGDSLDFAVSISNDGTKVAFTSRASNLVPGDTNHVSDVFVRDLATNTTTRVSLGANHAQLNTDSYVGSISGDGSTVALITAAAIDPADTNGVLDVYLVKLATGSVTLASRLDGPTGAVGSGPEYSPVDLTTDGSKVVFFSEAPNLTGNATYPEIVLRDLTTNKTTVVSRANGAAGAIASYASDDSISGDGRLVAFTSIDPNLVPGDTNGQADVFVRDLAANTTTLASRGPNGVVGNGASGQPSFDASGSKLAFASAATNLDPGATTKGHLFVRDLASGATTVVDRANGPSGALSDAGAFAPTISANGRCVVFGSAGTNLSPDVGRSDFIFVYMRTLAGECPNDPPDTMIGSKPPARTNNRTATFAFTSNDPTATFECSLDGGAFAACGSGQSYPGLNEGAHTFAVRAVDPAGNVDATPATAAWTVDATPPALRVTIPRQKLRRVLAHGLRLNLRASEPSNLVAALFYRGRRVGRLSVRLGTATRVLTIKLRPAKKARRALRRARSARFTLTVTATDDVGNARKVNRRFRLRR
jgi:hypothetical protein